MTPAALLCGCSSQMLIHLATAACVAGSAMLIQVGFVAIRELAVLLRNALSQKTQDAHKEVYCWQVGPRVLQASNAAGISDHIISYYYIVASHCMTGWQLASLQGIMYPLPTAYCCQLPWPEGGMSTANTALVTTYPYSTRDLAC